MKTFKQWWRYTAPEVMCKGAILAPYIETDRKLRRLEGDEA